VCDGFGADVALDFLCWAVELIHNVGNRHFDVRLGRVGFALLCFALLSARGFFGDVVVNERRMRVW
jgi:hypothetical protein